MQRRQFLSNAAWGITALPIAGAADSLNQQRAGGGPGCWLRRDDGAALQECDICGGDKPAEMVSRTTLPEIAPLRVDVCWVCQFSHEHTPVEGVCDECGEPIDDPHGGYSIEIEYPLGPADLAASKSATLCGECADWKAGDITHRGVSNDDTAAPRLGRLIDEETARLHELEESDE